MASVRQHFLDPLLVAFANQHVDVKNAFTLRSLFGQNMSCVRMSAFEFARRCRAETLCRTFVCF